MKQEREIKNMLALVLMKGKALLIGMIVGAILLGTYQGITQIKESRNPANSDAAIEAKYAKDMDEYNAKAREIQKGISEKESALERETEYIEDSLILKLNGNSLYTTKYILAITLNNDEDYLQTFEYSATPVSYMTNKIQSLYLSLWYATDLGEFEQLQVFDSIDKYLREVTSVYSLDGGLLTIQAYGNSAEDTKIMADAAYEFIMKQVDVVEDISYEHTIQRVSSGTQETIDSGFIDNYNNHINYQDSLQTELEELRKQEGELAQPAKKTGYTKRSMLKATVIYGVVGAIIGLLAVVFISLLICVMDSQVIASSEVENACGIPFLGLIGKGGKGLGALAYSISEGKKWLNRDAALAYTAAMLNAFVTKDSVLLTSTETIKDNEEITKLKEIIESAGHEVKVMVNGLNDTDRIKEVKKGVSVILVEKAASSKIDQIGSLSAKCKEMGSEVEGFILLK